jgi:hypothetical protein
VAIVIVYLLDFKFETDPYDVELHSLMTTTQYTEAIDRLNDKLKTSRSSFIDGALLASGPLLVPLIPWAVRHRNQTRRRKDLLKRGIHEFNMQYQELHMRWNRQPESTLTIERRHVDVIPPDAAYRRGYTEEGPTSPPAATTTTTATGIVAHATVVDDAAAAGLVV